MYPYHQETIEVDANQFNKRVHGFIWQLNSYYEGLKARHAGQVQRYSILANTVFTATDFLVDRFMGIEEDKIMQAVNETNMDFQLAQETMVPGFCGRLTTDEREYFSAVTRRSYVAKQYGPTDLLERYALTKATKGAVADFIKAASLHAKGAFVCGVDYPHLLEAVFRRSAVQAAAENPGVIVNFATGLEFKH